VEGYRSLERQAGLARDRGVRFEVTLNAPDVASGDDAPWWKELETQVRDIATTGATGVIVCHPFLLDLVKQVSELSVTVSTIAEVSSARAATRWAKLGADALVPSVEINKDPEELARIREQLPGVRLVLMVNEHCLGGCVWRAGHYLCTASGGRELDYHFRCKSEFLQRPWQVLANNAIRPEDVHRYEHLVDEIKVLGRTDPIDVLLERVAAYERGSWAGNFVELLDSRLARFIQVDNPRLGGLLDKQWACDFACEACGYCEGLFDSRGSDAIVRG